MASPKFRLVFDKPTGHAVVTTDDLFALNFRDGRTLVDCPPAQAVRTKGQVLFMGAWTHITAIKQEK